MLGHGLIRRREILPMGLAAAVVSRTRVVAGREVPIVNALDHLLLGVADLDDGMSWIEQRTGIRPAVGGSHPGRGTRNALLSLGAKQYLEIIAPDLAQPGVSEDLELGKLSEPRLINWAAATTDVEALAAPAKAAGTTFFGPRDGSRATPNGGLLKWRTLGLTAYLSAGPINPIPFFIQ